MNKGMSQSKFTIIPSNFFDLKQQPAEIEYGY
jgi:hypothetical protein